MTESCASCRFWHATRAECRRYPPGPKRVQTTVTSEYGAWVTPSILEAQFPACNPDQWCGEYVSVNHVPRGQ